MKHSTDYRNTFIKAARDCKAKAGAVPPEKKSKTVARAQYELIAGHPYRYRSDEILFSIWARRNGIPSSGMKEAREAFFSKGQACLRSSPLGKTYGWGFHFDAKGRVALIGVDDPRYEELSMDPSLTQTEAMRSSR